jgi:hypothetical protein
MFLNFQAVIAALGAGAVFRIANEARPAGDYLFNTILPERNMWTYNVDSGSMEIRPTMAGMVGMDSPYPPGGIVSVTTFLEQTAKLANEIGLNEATLRQMQQMMQQLAINAQPTTESLEREVLNFLDKVVLQPHFDAMEWLRGQALCFGSINWTYGRKDLVVSYGVPAGNIFATRSGTDYYGGTTSKFWTDVVNIRRALKGRVRAIIAHPDTIDLARYNPDNSMVVVGEGDGSITFRRVNADGQFTNDRGDTVSIVAYDREGEIIDPANPAQSLVVPMMERGKLVGIGISGGTRGFRVGEGATDDVDNDVAIGYTHIAPTIEGGGRPGRWSQLYTPENRPWELRGRAVTNGLPVIENPELVAIATTDMS